MAKDLLLEIGTEELPAGFIKLALLQLKKLASGILEDSRIAQAEIKTWGTPRRLSLYIMEVEEHQPDETQTVMGPGKNAPVEHQQGFAQKHGKNIEDLLTIKTEKGERLGVEVYTPGKPTGELLPQILPQIIQSLSFPKSMRWGEGDFRFARPIHWIMALYGTKKIVFELNDIMSGNYSYGHRFLSDGKIVIASPDKYLSLLAENHILVDQSKRKATIAKQLEDINRQLAKVYPGAHVIADNELLEEVTNLVEYPQAIVGYFDDEFLQLPPEVLICAMREHQRYFAVEDAAGDLCPAFVTIANMPDNEQCLIRKGNERVLRARLADAQFFYQEDLKKPLAERVEDLKGMTYQRDLGTYYDKAQRIEKLSKYIARKLSFNNKIELVSRAALLCKCDLLTEMVGEFHKLQGIMGKEYAWHSDEDEETAQAIYEHYLPCFVGDKLPNSTIGAIVSIADKLDTIVGCFGVGLLPSGSQDPYALRRQTVGVINILLAKTWHLSLEELVGQALRLIQDRLTKPADKVKEEVMDYFESRIFLMLEGSFHLTDAVISREEGCPGFDDVVDTKARLEALNSLSKEAAFDTLMIAARRVARIIPADYKPANVAPDLFQEEAEGLLYNQFQQIKAQLAQLLGKRDYPGALAQLVKLKPYVDRFFDEVLVMADDKALQNNRLALLSEIKVPFSQIADFSKIVIK